MPQKPETVILHRVKMFIAFYYRWVRYEEAVEEGGERWSKPHVASLMMEALLELQNLLATCPVFIDFPAQNITKIVGELRC